MPVPVTGAGFFGNVVYNWCRLVQSGLYAFNGGLLMRGVYAGIVTGTREWADKEGGRQVRTVVVVDTDLVELPGNGLKAGSQVWLVGNLRTWRDSRSGTVRHFFGDAPLVYLRDPGDDLQTLVAGAEKL